MAEARSVRLFDVHPDERRIAFLMCLYFFLVITSFWILKPLKKTLFIGHYAADGLQLAGRHLAAAEIEQLAKVANMFVAIGAVAVFSLLSNRLRREQLTFVFTTGFIAAYGVFAWALHSPEAASVWSFYLFGDLFSTPFFWGFFWRCLFWFCCNRLNFGWRRWEGD